MPALSCLFLPPQDLSGPVEDKGEDPFEAPERLLHPVEASEEAFHVLPEFLEHLDLLGVQPLTAPARSQ